ncbi:polyprenyl synthetase family protein [Streptomyces apricus]|uniref:Polyprenyl synthetase family protein n=1 Tax=Streptomyces apricus TaxID=1828112 RepID=A0A5B0BK65_9ACTN|nr:polyprenyl synthetase family protein [Streptomyces apricus]KAA0942613.1 polyprenyl synthetase family protein [Streptomyces apricus]
MRSSQAKDHSVAGAAPGPHPEPRPLRSEHTRGSAGGAHGAADGTARPGGGRPGPGRLTEDPRLPRFPLDMDDLHVIDTEVSAAVGRVLEDHLAERVERAAALDPVFGHDLAERVARFTLDGGKRIRSRFVWWALRACGGGPREAEAALRVGAALELIQTGALVHDDVMDDARLRRGRPALHVDVAAQYADSVPRELGPRFGEAAAILAGDLSLAWADDLLASVGTAPVAVRDLWSAMRTEMVAGQYLDLHGQATSSRSLARAIRAACLKSALYSVERPLALGAALAGADAARSEALCAAGRRVGIAFQLRDDLADVFGDPRRTGKPVGGDIRAGKPTYLVALAQARAEATGDRHGLAVLRRSLGRADLSDNRLEEVRDVLVTTGARTIVEARIERLVAQGMRHLDSVPLEPDARRRLRELLHATAGTASGGTASGGTASGGGTAPTAAPSSVPSASSAPSASAVSPGAPPGEVPPPGTQDDGTHASLLLAAGAEGAVR